METDAATADDTPSKPKTKKRRSHSLALDAIKEEKLVYNDLETGGEAVGIIQMSAIAHDFTTNSQFGYLFNMYVKPPRRSPFLCQWFWKRGMGWGIVLAV
jgi:hypothetical protein